MATRLDSNNCLTCFAFQKLFGQVNVARSVNKQRVDSYPEVFPTSDGVLKTLSIDAEVTDDLVSQGSTHSDLASEVSSAESEIHTDSNTIPAGMDSGSGPVDLICESRSLPSTSVFWLNGPVLPESQDSLPSASVWLGEPKNLDSQLPGSDCASPSWDHFHPHRSPPPLIGGGGNYFADLDVDLIPASSCSLLLDSHPTTHSQEYMSAGFGDSVPLSRTSSQTAAQQQIYHIIERISERRETVKTLQNNNSTLEKRGFTEEALAAVMASQKQARNLGEDLMEDMLSLDSLSNLLAEDQALRKDAIRDIELLLTDVDAVKAKLNNRCKSLQITQEKIDAVTQKRIDERQSEAHLTQTSPSQQVKVPEKHSDGMLAPSDQEKSEGKPQWKLGSILARFSGVKIDVQNQSSLDMTSQQASVVEEQGGTSAADGRHVWEKLELPLQFKPRQTYNRYVVEAYAPGLDMQSVKFNLNSDACALVPSLVVEGVCLPTDQEQEEIERSVISKLQEVAERCPEERRGLGRHRRMRSWQGPDVPVATLAVNGQLKMTAFSCSLDEWQGGASEAMSTEAYAEIGQGRFGRFSHSFHIPCDVRVSDIEAFYEDGKLKVVFPKKRISPLPISHQRHPLYKSTSWS